ncbi:ATP-binding protein [Ramlibacter albus]|uniref:histidine kinase n=1 Tax=Ramlibacter albus TaxID=2079448 RepID=A0A923MD93_9BURK|nr:response regulator [Ramlibacter albus]
MSAPQHPGILELLASASSALAGSLDPEDTLHAIARVIVPAIADWCRIDLVDEAGVPQRRLAYHSDPDKSREALALARQVRALPETVGSMAWCAKHARSHHGSFDDAPAAADPALRGYTQHFGMREHYIVPLVAHGRTLGAMGVVQAESGRSLAAEDCALIDELARRAALALDNASAYAAAESARKRLELLANASSALARSLDVEDTLRTIATTLVPAVADWCRIDLLDDAGVQHRRISYHSDPQRAERALALARELQVSPDARGSMAWCIREREPSYGRFDEPPVSEDPALRRFNEAFGMRAFYVVPLVARGRTLGALRVTQAESGRDLGEQDCALILELGQRAALALDNAHAYADADTARRQAEAASRAKDEFLAMLGHELRNPLAPIATALELMARRDAASHVEERRIIERQVRHLSRLIDDLLDVSRITQGKVELKREPVDLRVVVAHAIEQTQPIFKGRAAPAELRLPAGPVMVQGDAVRLTQVVCNLLVNAAKFTPAQGRIAVRVALAGGEAVVEVEDTGRGIGADLLPQVFELFVQGRQSIDRQSGGLGLGLAIVRMLVERHGGRVAASSDGEGRGSRFTVTLPAIEAGAATVANEPAAPANAPSGLRLMIVDDNADAAETLAELLRVVGCEVRCAGDGDSALRLLDEYRPQLALLDIGLPGYDGYELATRMRGDPRTSGMKLVALTGYGRDNDRQRALAARFDEHLVKPVEADRLFRTLSGLLGVPL